MGTILASLAIMGSILYFVYSYELQPYNYRFVFRLNISYVNPGNTSDVREAQIPTGIGVDSNLWNYHGLDQFGVTGRAPIYTLDPTGIIRVQSTVNINYTLGDFFMIWGRFLNGTCVQVDRLYCSNPKTGMFLGFFVNGSVNSDYDQYVLKDQDALRISYLPLG